MDSIISIAHILLHIRKTTHKHYQIIMHKTLRLHVQIHYLPQLVHIHNS